MFEDAAGSAAGSAVPGVGWINTASTVLKMFSGNTDVSGSASASGALLNTSGAVLGKGNASGGTLSNQAIEALPWYVWAAGALLGMAIIKKVVK